MEISGEDECRGKRKRNVIRIKRRKSSRNNWRGFIEVMGGKYEGFCPWRCFVVHSKQMDWWCIYSYIIILIIILKFLIKSI